MSVHYNAKIPDECDNTNDKNNIAIPFGLAVRKIERADRIVRVYPSNN